LPDIDGVMSSVEHERQVQQWQKQRLARLTANDGWLSLVGRFELPIGTARVGSDAGCEVQLPSAAPPQLGLLTRDASGVTFVPTAGVTVGVQRARALLSETVTAARRLTTDAHGEPDRLVYGSLLIEIMERGNTFAARVRDTEAQARTAFAGIDTYPIDGAWRIVARLLPYQPEKRIELLYESGDPEPYRSPGAAIFTWQGVEYRLDPVFDGSRPRLYVIFGDETNRDSTYGAGRFLYAALPQDGQVVLDFNQAFNPPCAFTPYAVCPLPPPQNRLALRVEAGEKRPHA
jgi:uncharacterized protein (DUF1684 family)